MEFSGFLSTETSQRAKANKIYGLVTDPTPDKGRALGRVLEQREKGGNIV